jgi:hypothetical protein
MAGHSSPVHNLMNGWNKRRIYVWLHINLVGSRCHGRSRIAHRLCVYQEPHAKTMDGWRNPLSARHGGGGGGAAWWALNWARTDPSIRIPPLVSSTWALPACVRVCSLAEIDANHPSSPSYAACERSTRDDWCASFFALGNQNSCDVV